MLLESHKDDIVHRIHRTTKKINRQVRKREELMVELCDYCPIKIDDKRKSDLRVSISSYDGEVIKNSVRFLNDKIDYIVRDVRVRLRHGELVYLITGGDVIGEDKERASTHSRRQVVEFIRVDSIGLLGYETDSETP